MIVTERPVAGWSVASTDGATVALDLELTDDLLGLGHAREVVRALQEARKNAGLEVTDRIAVTYAAANSEAATVLSAHGESIADEILAVRFEPGTVTPEDAVELTELGMRFSLQPASR